MPLSIRSFLSLTVFLLAPVVLTACDSADDEGVAGTYEATEFLAEIEGQDVNVLEAGGDLRITLRDDESFSATFVVPEVLSEGEDVPSAFSGTYAISGSSVSFSTEADVFVRDADWTLDGEELRTTSFGFSVVLEKD